MTKVTYYMYSCDTCCMISETMEMNGRDCAKCQNSEKMTLWELLKLLMIIRTKGNSVIFSKIKRPKHEGDAVGAGFVNLERESVTSL